MLETTPHPYKETPRSLPATSPEIHHLTRLKYVGDSDYHFPFLDLSYAQALTHNGELVGVDMPPPSSSKFASTQRNKTSTAHVSPPVSTAKNSACTTRSSTTRQNKNSPRHNGGGHFLIVLLFPPARTRPIHVSPLIERHKLRRRQFLTPSRRPNLQLKYPLRQMQNVLVLIRVHLP